MWRWVVLLLLFPVAGQAACRDMLFEGLSYTVCEAVAQQDLRLFQSGVNGAYGSFAAVDTALAAQGLRLSFAMNAGMFHHDLSPVGLYIESGAERTPLVTRDGPGNFGLLPNGVFCIGETLQIIESLVFKADKTKCRYATQSGPMLVIKGALHPKFLANSESFNIRNGVGVSEDGARALFVISNQEVNFYTFARFFRDGLEIKDALYLDGSISRLFASELNRHDGGFPMGPIVGLAVPRG